MNKISLSRFNYIATNSQAMPYRCEKRYDGTAIKYAAIKFASLCMLPSAFKYGPR